MDSYYINHYKSPWKNTWRQDAEQSQALGLRQIRVNEDLEKICKICRRNPTKTMEKPMENPWKIHEVSDLPLR